MKSEKLKSILNRDNNSMLFKHNGIYVWFICSLIIALLVLLLAECVYGTIDDFYMAMISDGVFGDEFRHCLIYSSSALGWLLRFFNKIYPANWYMLIQYLLLCISISLFSAISYQKTKNVNCATLSLFCGWVFIILPIFINVTFTCTAGICTIIALIGIVEFYNKDALLCVISLIISLFGFLYRYESFLLVTPFLLVYILFKFYNKKLMLNDVKKMIIYFSLLLVLIGCSKLVDLKTYKSDEWQNYIERSDIRSLIQDYNVSVPVDDFKNLGITWSSNDFEMLRTLKLDNKEVFNLENFKKLLANTQVNYMGFEGTIVGIKNFYLDTFPLLQIIGFILVLVLSIIISRKLFIQDIIINLLAILINAYLIYEGRYPTRVAITIWSCIYLLMYLELLSYKVISHKNVLICLLAASVLLLGVQIISNKKNNSKKYDLIGTITKDKDHLYVVDIFAFGESNIMKPIENIPSNYMSNFIVSGGWLCQSPMSENMCNKHGANNTLDILGNREDVFYVMQEADDVKVTEKYLQEHYDKTIKSEVAELLGGGYISYKFIRKNK